MVSNPGFAQQKRRTLAGLTDAMIDAPILPVIQGLNRLPGCFTLQCCYGHFLYKGHWDPHNLDALPASGGPEKVEYRIAYVAFCLEDNDRGWALSASLKSLANIDPRNIQYGSAGWFWSRQVNSYALQVEPERFKQRDKAILDFREARYIEQVRNRFFLGLEDLLKEMGPC
jgi:hypothetical protein